MIGVPVVVLMGMRVLAGSGGDVESLLYPSLEVSVRGRWEVSKGIRWILSFEKDFIWLLTIQITFPCFASCDTFTTAAPANLEVFGLKGAREIRILVDGVFF